jgi:LPXTG-site transpeptidase (sortase) family protein
MPSNTTTDNVFPYARTGQYFYRPRPKILNTISSARPSVRISDFLPPAGSQKAIETASSPTVAQPALSHATLPKAKLSYWWLTCPLMVILPILAIAAYVRNQIPQQVVRTEVIKALPAAAQEVPTTPLAARPGLPIRLRIPQLGLNTSLEHVGLTAEGDIDVPISFDNAGWYNQGPRPGESGQAVIDGHFGYRQGKPGVFNDLHKLKLGDKLYVDDQQGGVNIFAVREVRTYDPDQDAADVFKPSKDGLAHLNLITCEGSWNQTEETYSSRLVIFTDKVSE